MNENHIFKNSDNDKFTYGQLSSLEEIGLRISGYEIATVMMGHEDRALVNWDDDILQITRANGDIDLIPLINL